MKQKKIVLFSALVALVAVAVVLCVQPAKTSAASSADSVKTSVYYPSEPSKQYSPRRPRYRGEPAPAPLMAAPVNGERVIERTGYTCSYNSTLRQPNYVAWALTPTRTYGQNQREPEFYEDIQLPRKSRALLSDYYNSRMTRGHMCPAADNKWNSQAMRESFILSNVCPQTYTLNSEDWEELESFCRDWVRANQAVLYIVCGPVFTSDPPTRLRRRLYVPNKFFKALVCLTPGSEQGIAFVYDNNTAQHPMSYHACTIDRVEAMTGYNLFASLPADLQQRIESQSDLSAWR